MSKVAQDKSGIVAALPKACSDELAAVEFLEAQRWGILPAARAARQKTCISFADVMGSAISGSSGSAAIAEANSPCGLTRCSRIAAFRSAIGAMRSGPRAPARKA